MNEIPEPGPTQVDLSDSERGFATDYIQYSENRGLHLLVDGKWRVYSSPSEEARRFLFDAFCNTDKIDVRAWYNANGITMVQYRKKA